MSFSAVTYNIRHAVLDDEVNAWERRRPGVRRLLREIDPGVLGLQECAGDQHTDVAADLPAYEWVGVADDPGSGEHNPIGTTDRFRVLSTDSVWLSPTPTEPGSCGWDGAYPRVLTTLTVSDTLTDRTLTVFNTHFDHRGSEARRESARLVRNRIDALPAERPALVMGDFNCRPGSDAYDLLTDDSFDRPLGDARALAGTVTGPGTTVTRFTDLDPDRRLDHVFVTPGLDVLTYTVRTDTDESGRYPSDHLPTAVTLEYGGPGESM